MKAKLLVIGIIAILIAVGFSGCTEEKSEPEKNLPPKIFIFADNLTGITPFMVNFTSNGTDENGFITEYMWDFGDGLNSSEQNPTHIFQNHGLFNVTLKVWDDKEESNQTNLTIEVKVQKPIIVENISFGDEDFFYIVGKVKNLASVCINYVQINGTLYDSQGNIIKNTCSFYHFLNEISCELVSPMIIEPGDYGYFKIIFEDVPNYDYYDLEIESFNTFYNKTYDEDLVIENVEISYPTWWGYRHYQLTGTIKNNNTTNYCYPDIYGVFYDSNGKLLDMELGDIDLDSNFELGPGQQADFEISVYEWNVKPNKIADYEIIIDNFLVISDEDFW